MHWSRKPRLSKKIPLNLNELQFNILSTACVAQLVDSNPTTRQIWHEIPNAHVQPNTLEAWERFLFVKNSWQLTVLGAKLMQNLYQCYRVGHVNNALASGRALISMNASLNSPWYWQGEDIFIWNQDSYFELSLFDGDVKRFIDFKQPKS